MGFLGKLVYISIIIAILAVILKEFGKRHRATKGMTPFLTEARWRLTQDTIPDVSSKTILVTGANVGLGFSTSKLLALNGAHVIMACRSKEKCDNAASSIRSLDPKGSVETILVDLSSLKSVRNMAKQFFQTHSKLDSLILNAGIMHPPFTLTVDGIESQFAVNHLAHFYLTQLLLPALEAAQPSTIVSVSSNGHFGTYSTGVKLSLEDINEKTSYNSILAYGQSKLCNVLFAQELSKRLIAQGKKIYVNSLNPGAVNTELLREYPQFLQDLAKYIFGTFKDQIMFEPDTAALTQIYLAVSPDVFDQKITGQYYVPIAEPCDTSDHAKEIELQERLWKMSEDILKQLGFS